MARCLKPLYLRSLHAASPIACTPFYVTHRTHSAAHLASDIRFAALILHRRLAAHHRRPSRCYPSPQDQSPFVRSHHSAVAASSPAPTRRLLPHLLTCIVPPSLHLSIDPPLRCSIPVQTANPHSLIS
ncbi:hypothetical protein U1Q18_014639 [Sarracenia purpurea var. burkii]